MSEFLAVFFFFPLYPQAFVAGRAGVGGWLVLDLPVNQIHQESVAEEIKIMEQWEVAGKKKKEGQGFLNTCDTILKPQRWFNLSTHARC